MNALPSLLAMYHTLFPTAFGTCGLAWHEAGLIGFQLPERDEIETGKQLARRTSSAVASEPLPEWIQSLIVRVQEHLSGKLQDFADAPIDWSRVSEFQRGVFHHTVAIKPGYKKSYGEIAKLMSLGNESARAVGVALGSNPWPLIVPCHRVVSASDKMTGFSGPGGIRTKTRLLALEGAELISE